eukprot:CAMPEP_0177200098 /NCGR_PEP_ID=MMETSP0367-20130122/26036_1 /TAXON_ID=447022 ORGANISM="Scrippsiella hangoei-like, Strain SHHI-4" /NCGR_SAMPLE_ID=MMETSP0367 /ASSEMBLY_ACC=CAM_ASM_000362 /LENGTH=791 /DNA_ID=CAMNT_0018648511 /DNA_START=12 /DNA_END=2387 /DNA_ORIENTATION=-
MSVQLGYEIAAGADPTRASGELSDESAPPTPAGRLGSRRWAGRACVGAAALALLAVGFVALSWRSDREIESGSWEDAVELEGGYLQGSFEKALKGRAGKQGTKVSLANSLLGKNSSLPDCPGYDTGCAGLKWPMPYKIGEYPKVYDYEGKFPKDFIWGMGTAAYQIEGAYREDGRGASIWDTFSGADTVGMPGAACSYCCKKPPCDINAAMFDKGATGNVAADHYHMWETDIAMMKSMGLKHYRFSISWPRLIPTGKVKDGVNEKGKAFYNGLIDALLEAGITPYVTLYHWDLPQGLLDPPKVGGWWSRDSEGKPDGAITQDFVDYGKVCFEAFGDRVKTWVTFNEPWTALYLASGWGKAPSIPEFSDMTTDPWIGGHNLLNAHAAVVDLYRQEFKYQGGQIGITNNCDWREPKTTSPEDIAAAERSVLFQLGWMSDPIFGKEGDYPPEMRKVYGDRLPNFTHHQTKLLKGSADFYGLNHYGTSWAAYDPTTPGADLSYANVTHEGLPEGMSIWLFGSGWGFRKMMNWVGRRYDNPLTLVTEGGWSLPADTAAEAVSDHDRVMYYANYTSEMLKAIHEDKLNIKGYFAWSLMDNYEWERGYKERFGTAYTDFDYGYDKFAPCNNDSQPTVGRQWRQRKDSSCWLEQVSTKNALTSPSKSDFPGCVDSSVFDGLFNDTTSGCNRTMQLVGSSGKADILGSMPKMPWQPHGCGQYGKQACPKAADTCTGSDDDMMEIKGVRVSGGSIVVDYSKKGGPQNFGGFWNDATKSIIWADGNVWEKVGIYKKVNVKME